MGFFDKFKKAEQTTQENIDKNVVKAPVTGIVIEMEKIPDPVFSAGALGKCCGIEPEEELITAPVDGEIVQVSDTLHAVGIEGTNGAEILIHVGVDTVEMNGEGFEAFVKVGDKVKVGQKLLTMSLDKIRSAGYETCVITVVTNSDEFEKISLAASGKINKSEELLNLIRA